MSTHDSQRQAKVLGLLAALAVSATACGSDTSTSPGIAQPHFEPKPVAIEIDVSQARVVAGDEIEVTIHIPGRGAHELAVAEAYVEWDETRFVYLGGTVFGWDEFRHTLPSDGRCTMW